MQGGEEPPSSNAHRQGLFPCSLPHRLRLPTRCQKRRHLRKPKGWGFAQSGEVGRGGRKIEERIGSGTGALRRARRKVPGSGGSRFSSARSPSSLIEEVGAREEPVEPARPTGEQVSGGTNGAKGMASGSGVGHAASGGAGGSARGGSSSPVSAVHETPGSQQEIWSARRREARSGHPSPARTATAATACSRNRCTPNPSYPEPFPLPCRTTCLPYPPPFSHPPLPCQDNSDSPSAFYAKIAQELLPPLPGPQTLRGSNPLLPRPARRAGPTRIAARIFSVSVCMPVRRAA